ncbi:MAG TPA: response regulator [Chloroflexota bacterium]|nr:response regulator [Chloroflexota bacterium]
MRLRFRWQRPLALKLTLIITLIIVIVVTVITTLTVNRERHNFQGELEQQAELLLNTLAASGADSLYFLEADYLSDVMRDLGDFQVVTHGRYYDREGRIIADAINLDDRFNREPDIFGKVLLAGESPIYVWQDDQLIAGEPVIVGAEKIGAVSIGLPTAPLAKKLTAVRQQGIVVAMGVALFGLVLALLVSRSITEPLQQMIAATEHVRQGDLSQRVYIYSGDELQTLGDHFNDMTAQLEKTLRQMEQEIDERKRAQAELQAAKEAAEAANRAKSAFLANMSHELRTPLNAILGFAQLMVRRNQVGPKDRNNLDIILHSGEHLLTLINQVLDMSKIEAGRMTLHERPFHLYAMMEELESMFRLRAKEKNVQLIMDVDADMPPMIIADETKLRQVLINLLNNALKFTEQGQVRLQVQYESGTAVSSAPIHLLHFTVEDSGPGIESDELDKVFEAFVRAKAGIQSNEGTGLGLTLSRQFARLMGGDMTVRNVNNEPGHGAIFEFTIHIKPDEGADERTKAAPLQIVGLAPDQPETRVLVVDDNWENRQVLVELLRPLGFVVDEVADGKAAVEAWHVWQPQLILMDMHMPKMDGYEATRTILGQADGQKPVIIAITASAFSHEREAILGAGCSDFIRKPVQTSYILETIQKHLAVQYLYAEATEVDTAVPAIVGANGQEAEPPTLPPMLLTQLRQATSQADMEQIEKLVTAVHAYNPALADELQRLADDFEYGKILGLLQTEEVIE